MLSSVPKKYQKDILNLLLGSISELFDENFLWYKNELVRHKAYLQLGGVVALKGEQFSSQKCPEQCTDRMCEILEGLFSKNCKSLYEQAIQEGITYCLFMERLVTKVRAILQQQYEITANLYEITANLIEKNMAQYGGGACVKQGLDKTGKRIANITDYYKQTFDLYTTICDDKKNKKHLIKLLQATAEDKASPCCHITALDINFEQVAWYLNKLNSCCNDSEKKGVLADYVDNFWYLVRSHVHDTTHITPKQSRKKNRHKKNQVKKRVGSAKGGHRVEARAVADIDSLSADDAQEADVENRSQGVEAMAMPNESTAVKRSVEVKDLILAQRVQKWYACTVEELKNYFDTTDDPYDQQFKHQSYQEIAEQKLRHDLLPLPELLKYSNVDNYFFDNPLKKGSKSAFCLLRYYDEQQYISKERAGFVDIGLGDRNGKTIVYHLMFREASTEAIFNCSTRNFAQNFTCVLSKEARKICRKIEYGITEDNEQEYIINFSDDAHSRIRSLHIRPL